MNQPNFHPRLDDLAVYQTMINTVRPPPPPQQQQQHHSKVHYASPLLVLSSTPYPQGVIFPLCVPFFLSHCIDQVLQYSMDSFDAMTHSAPRDNSESSSMYDESDSQADLYLPKPHQQQLPQRQQQTKSEQQKLPPSQTASQQLSSNSILPELHVADVGQVMHTLSDRIQRDVFVEFIWNV